MFDLKMNKVIQNEAYKITNLKCDEINELVFDKK